MSLTFLMPDIESRLVYRVRTHSCLMCSALQMDSALIFFATIAAAVAFVGVGIGTVTRAQQVRLVAPMLKEGMPGCRRLLIRPNASICLILDAHSALPNHPIQFPVCSLAGLTWQKFVAADPDYSDSPQLTRCRRTLGAAPFCGPEPLISPPSFSPSTSSHSPSLFND